MVQSIVGVSGLSAEQKAQKAAEDAKKEKKPVMTRCKTKFICANKGCKDKSFKEEETKEDACHHHVGEPVFHDLKKYWTCRNGKPAYDWDEFMLLPTCAVGAHQKKYK